MFEHQREGDGVGHRFTQSRPEPVPPCQGIQTLAVGVGLSHIAVWRTADLLVAVQKIFRIQRAVNGMELSQLRIGIRLRVVENVLHRICTGIHIRSGTYCAKAESNLDVAQDGPEIVGVVTDVAALGELRYTDERNAEAIFHLVIETWARSRVVRVRYTRCDVRRDVII